MTNRTSAHSYSHLLQTPFLLKQKYLFTVAFELPPAHTNPHKMLILIRQNFLQRVCSKCLFKFDHLLSFYSINMRLAISIKPP